ncbi:MAG: hypothetical protein V7695_08985 [Sulfitobacter sp.]
MLAIPMGFADWLALSYSGFASVKLGLIALGMLLIGNQCDDKCCWPFDQEAKQGLWAARDQAEH